MGILAHAITALCLCSNRHLFAICVDVYKFKQKIQIIIKSKEPILWSQHFYVEKATYLKAHADYEVKLKEIIDTLPSTSSDSIITIDNNECKAPALSEKHREDAHFKFPQNEI